MYRSSSSSSTYFSDNFHSQSNPSFNRIEDVAEQLPTFNPQSYVAKKEFNRLRSAESAIHIIPLLVLFCVLILWFFSNPGLDVDL